MTFPDINIIRALGSLPHLSGATLEAVHEYLGDPDEWEKDLALGPDPHGNEESNASPGELALQYREAKALCETLKAAVQTHWVQLLEAKAV